MITLYTGLNPRLMKAYVTYVMVDVAVSPFQTTHQAAGLGPAGEMLRVEAARTSSGSSTYFEWKQHVLRVEAV